MATLVIFAALIYLVGHLGFKAEVVRIVNLILAAAGILLWLIGCLGADVPLCFRS